MARYRKKASGKQLQEINVCLSQNQLQQEEISTKISKRNKNGKIQQKSSETNNYQNIKQIPTIYLTKSQMNSDPISLIQKLQTKYKQYGAVKLKTCQQWNPPFCFNNTQSFISTRIQKIHQLAQGKPFKQNLQNYTIKSYTSLAKKFEENYKFKSPPTGSTKQTQLQYQFWNIVNNGNNKNSQNYDKWKTKVQYAADLPVNKHGSGFPLYESLRHSDQHFNYAKSPFNLNNMYKSSTSLTNISQQRSQSISGVTIPWIYMGMLFSAFCWHVQDLLLNSINYSHTGATKTWYIVPQSDKQKFQALVKSKHGQNQVLSQITYLLDPQQLIRNGIKVYKAFQRPKQYIITLFGAYHCGFSQGFNVGEAVNVIGSLSLPVIKKALIKSQQNKKNKPPVICYDWLVSNNITNRKLEIDQIRNQYKTIIEIQRKQVKENINKIKDIKILQNEAKYDRMSCFTCKHYLYFSSLQCLACDKKYCYNHSSQCCGQGLALLTRKPDEHRKHTVRLVESKIKQTQ